MLSLAFKRIQLREKERDENQILDDYVRNQEMGLRQGDKDVESASRYSNKGIFMLEFRQSSEETEGKIKVYLKNVFYNKYVSIASEQEYEKENEEEQT